MLTPEQIRLIQPTFRQIMPVSDETARLFYRKLFELNPSSKLLFRPDSKAQATSFIEMLAILVAGLTMFDTMTPAIEELGRRHVHYHVQIDDYRVVGEALVWALSQMLGPAFTPEVKAAWEAAYSKIADAAIRGAASTVTQ
jgi:hemoglobin-like flavoprotein